MSASIETLQRKIRSAGELQLIVRTMKSFAASNIGQYERAVASLTDYHRTVELGLRACLHEGGPAAVASRPGLSRQPMVTRAVVFGSDQGLVGRFNETVVELALATLAPNPGVARIWAVGERVHACLADAGVQVKGLFVLPSSVQGITALVAQVLSDIEVHRGVRSSPLWIFHNGPMMGNSYEPVSQQLLPIDASWRARIARTAWPTKNPPEVIGERFSVLRALIREYLFISLFQACAESLASENASRLVAMQRADKNIGDLLEQFRGSFNRIRQDGIDEELFDVISGFEASES